NHIFKEIDQQKILRDFRELCDYLDASDHYLLILLPHLQLLSRQNQSSENGFIQQQLEKLLRHEKCRFLIISQKNSLQHFPDLAYYFSVLKMKELSDTEIISLLKYQRMELENYHQVIISDELLMMAYALAEYYLSAAQTIEKTIALLDHSAARTSLTKRINPDSNPALTRADLLHVLSNWTNIPSSHLTLGKFKLNEFLHGLQQKLLGQDAALTVISHALLQTPTHLQPEIHSGNSLLFVGPPHSGKKTAAIALTEQLFNQLNPLYIAKSSLSINKRVINLTLERYKDKQHFLLHEVIEQTPYAVILFENIEQFSTQILDDLKEILSTACLTNEGHVYSFSRALMLFSTTFATKRLMETNHFFSDETEETQQVDLLQLITHEKKQYTTTNPSHSSQELVHDIKMEISEMPIAFIADYAKIVPFTPPHQATTEKIIRAKLKQLANTLTLRYTVDFVYAPEIVRYLVNLVSRKQALTHQTTDIHLVFKQLYCTVEQALLAQVENQHNPHVQLLLQLNETGELLHCDWVPAPKQHFVAINQDG
ncbi:MAG: ATP-dependent Clp protease ATP-binding subunit, partial [Gammaproteobacteria bacterium]|nr:ATP-dependent Clp protease ATP-binding subunit [Gammaproteobacteria bacterium]